MSKLYNRLLFVWILAAMLFASLLSLLIWPASISAETETIFVIVEIDMSGTPLPIMRGASLDQRRAVQIDKAQYKVEEVLPETSEVTHHYESFPYSIVAISPNELSAVQETDGVAAVYENEQFYATLCRVFAP